MTAIRVENLSKRYVLRHNSDRRDGLRHSLETAFRAPLKWLSTRRIKASQEREEFWALKDVSFDINQGDAVAIIGRNGAGKSTLLKILSRITEPTEGRIHLKGRVASLLEVGTGFHQELTGRENIYLNGAILGMSRAEIKSRFDEIVAFSEVEKFLDTPVKRYSSGMYVRLAFAVAAHLEPEILIVDEVLAVGDAAFQRKCLGRMGEVSKSGRTVLFVSHNIGAVQSLCSTAIYLDTGRVKQIGDVSPVLNSYAKDAADARKGGRERRKLDRNVLLEYVKFAPSTIQFGSPVSFEIAFSVNEDTCFSMLNVLIDSVRNVRVAHLDLRSVGMPLTVGRNSTLVVKGQISSVPLVEGEYTVGLTVRAGSYYDNIFDVTSFVVDPRPWDRDYARSDASYRGVIELDYVASQEKHQRDFSLPFGADVEREAAAELI